MGKRLLGTSHKIELSRDAVGVLATVLYLSPADEAREAARAAALTELNKALADFRTTCQWSTKACRAACLGHSSGMMVYPTHKLARIRKTLAFYRDQPAFMAQLDREIEAHARKATRLGLAPAVRLNGASDLPWEITGVMGRHPDVAFYDYTKSEDRALASLRPSWPSNYSLTFSRTGTRQNDAACRRVLDAGGNVAVVFASVEAFPDTWKGFPVLSGEVHDARFLDAPGHVVALKARGKAKRDRSGFVVR